MVKLSIRQKILALVLAATIIPFALINVFWVNIQRHTLLDNAKETQIAATNKDAGATSLFIDEEVQQMIFRAQDMAVDAGEKSSHDFDLDVRAYMLEDNKNLVSAQKVFVNGQEQVSRDQNGELPLQNVSGSPVFQALKRGANRYISSAKLDSSGAPLVTLGVAIPKNIDPPVLAQLVYDDTRPANSTLGFNGALITQLDFQVLWTSILSQSVNSPGSVAFVVDGKGDVVAYPKQLSSRVAANLSSTPIVADYLHRLNSAGRDADNADLRASIQAKSENGVNVLATYQNIKGTDWAIVVEDPIANVYKGINQITEIGLIIALLAFILFVVISLWLSKYISRPILHIANVAGRIGRGDFDARVDGGRSDEIGTLGQSVNAMGQNLKVSVGQIENQRRQLEAILNNTTDAILSVDDHGTVSVANNVANTFFEFNDKSLSGQHIGALMRSVQSNADPLNWDFSTLKPGVHVFTDLTYTSPSQKTRYIDVVVFKIESSIAGAASNQSIVTIHDETKRRELDNMKVDFVSMAAHELRTPLSAVQGYLELVLDGELQSALSEKVNYYLKHAQSSAGELGALISNLLNVTRLEHGTLHMHMEKVDLAAKAGETVKNSQFNAANKKINLSYTGPQNECFVVADGATLQEVLNNLLDNAIKYTPQGGSVNLSFNEQGGKNVVKVRDTGCGIPESALPHLFTKFYRVHSGLETGSAGTGLGLYLSKTILESFDGTITVQSVEGMGSEFTVTLPLYNEARLQELISSQVDDGFNKGDNRGWTTTNTPR